jgi:AcrR family transcriptional regulator
VGRPREHDLDAVLDHARELWVRGGEGAVTIRALSAAAGVSNGAIYHAFGSRDGLRAAVWAREAGRFLADLETRVDRVLAGDGSATEAVLAAATSSGDYALVDEAGARLLLSALPQDLVTSDLPADRVEELAALRRRLDELIGDLAERLWDRRDRAARTAVRCCLVELPSALLLAPRPTGEPGRPDDPAARRLLELAVRGILAEEP